MPGSRQSLELSARSASRSISVIGLPLAGQIGLLSRSILLVLASGKSLPSLPLYVSVLLTAAGSAVEPVLGSCLMGVLALGGLASEDVARSCKAACCRVVRELRGVRRAVVASEKRGISPTLALVVLRQVACLM